MNKILNQLFDDTINKALNFSRKNITKSNSKKSILPNINVESINDPVAIATGSIKNVNYENDMIKNISNMSLSKNAYGFNHNNW